MKNNRHYICRYKSKVNPKIAKDITNIIKPYWDLINKSSDYYKLRTLAVNVNRINFRVKEDVERLLTVFKHAIRCKIEKRIDQLYGAGKTKDYNIRNIKQFLEKHKIDNIYYSAIFNAIYGNILINLSLEDFKMITNNARKAKFYSAEIGDFGSNDVDKLMKSKLKGMNNAILILTGNKETTFDELDYVWTYALKYLPKSGKTSFAYKIDDVDKLQLSLMAVK
ncbi:MAG: hypothetical protein Q7J54_02425 [Candidatus Woesearchaeota archaeon]|nr:hypothetical protein [Candidatus Woesearchaeota archaeon]